MEAAGTPPPESAQPTPPPPPPSSPGDEGKPSGGWRALGVVLALALAFAGAVMVVAMIDIGDTATCEDVRAGEAVPNDEGECFDGSSAQKTVSLVLGWPSGVLAGIAALVALFYAATGRQGQLLLRMTGTAIVLGGLSILVGSV